MPRSKRNKTVSLTKTKAKGRDQKTKLIETIRANVDEYSRIYAFSFGNLREGHFSEIRRDWKESRIYLGKNSLTKIAFGRSPEEEYKDNLYRVGQLLDGNVGLLFTSRSHEEVVTYFSNFKADEFAKAGAILEKDIVIPPGPIPNHKSFPTSMLDQFRKLGMVAEVDDTVIILRQEFIAAKKGVPLTPEQAKALTHFGIRTVIFSLNLLCHWTDGEYEEL